MNNNDKNNLYKEISVGIAAGFIGQYIGDVIYNFLENKGYSYEIRSTDSLYIAGIISGGAVAVFNNKLPLFSSVVLSVGMFYVVFDASDKLMGGKGMNEKNLLKEFIFDAIVVYILIMLQNTFIDLFFPDLENNNNTLFSDEIIITLITGIIINSYYDIKKIIQET